MNPERRLDYQCSSWQSHMRILPLALSCRWGPRNLLVLVRGADMSCPAAPAARRPLATRHEPHSRLSPETEMCRLSAGHIVSFRLTSSTRANTWCVWDIAGSTMLTVLSIHSLSQACNLFWSRIFSSQPSVYRIHTRALKDDPLEGSRSQQEIKRAAMVSSFGSPCE